MKAILLSIRPEHLVNILNGKKTIEIRKSKLPLNIPVYLYCTKGKPQLGCHTEYKSNIHSNENGIRVFTQHGTFSKKDYFNGKVVAKCVFNEIYWLENEWASERLENGKFFYQGYFDKACIDRLEAWKYANGKDLYAYKISNLEIFNEPKELYKFKKWRTKQIYSGMDCPPYVDEVLQPLTKAPKPWCYVEEMK